MLGDWLPLTHGVSEKSFGSRIPYTLPTLLSRRLPAALQFPVSLKQEGSAPLATWHVQIPDKIITELSVRHSDHQEIGADFEVARVQPGWGMMPMYSRQTSVSTQLGVRPTIVFSGDVSSTWQHFIGTPLKKTCEWGKRVRFSANRRGAVFICLFTGHSALWCVCVLGSWLLFKI